MGADLAEANIFKKAPGPAKEALRGILHDITKYAFLSDSDTLAITMLISKPNGGERPITHTPILYRILCRLSGPWPNGEKKL